MDDLTKIKGIGKATAAKLSAAGFDSFAKLAALTVEDMVILQEAGSAMFDIGTWKTAAGELVTNASQGEGGNGADGSEADASVAAAPAENLEQNTPATAALRTEIEGVLDELWVNSKREITTDSITTLRIRVTAPSGHRRRAGISFGTVPRVIEMHELGATIEDQAIALKKLLSDPALSVSPADAS